MDAVTKRRNAIAEFIDSKGQITFAQLKEYLPNVSEMTLRSDLKMLDAEKRIVRIHGGAKSVERVLGNDDLMTVRQVKAVGQKQLIAKKAADLIRPNMTIFLDSGSTTTELAKAIPDMNLIVFTCSLTCALELASKKNIKVYVTGGELNTNSLSVYGSRALDDVKNINFEQAFMGVTSYHRKQGFTCGSYNDNLMKQAVIRRADRKIVLMDSSKVGGRVPYSICDADAVTDIVSDGGLPEDFVEIMTSHGVRIH